MIKQAQDNKHPVLRHISSLAAGLAGLVYNNRCPACGLWADSARTFPICRTCMDSATGYTGPACNCCAKPFASRYSRTCGDCLSTPPEFERAMSFGLYEGTLMAAIHAMKFGSARRLATPLALKLATLELPVEVDAMVPVPMTRRSLRGRGFNQSALMARELAGLKGIPLMLHMLEKIRETAPQLGLSRRLRMKNLKGAFLADDRATGLSILLVDDVITTGATVRECARALKHAGAAAVTALSLARTY